MDPTSNCRSDKFGVSDEAWTCHCEYCNHLGWACRYDECKACGKIAVEEWKSQHDEDDRFCKCAWTCRCDGCASDRAEGWKLPHAPEWTDAEWDKYIEAEEMHKSRIAVVELHKSRYDKSPKLVDEEHAKIIWEKNNLIATIIVDGKEMRSELYTQIAVLQTQNRNIDRLRKENDAVLQTQNRDIDRLRKENDAFVQKDKVDEFQRAEIDYLRQEIKAFRKKESKMRLLLSDQNAPAKKRCAI